VEGADDGFWNILWMSSFAGLDGVEGIDCGGVDDDDGAKEGLDEIEDLPLTWPTVAGTDPKDFTPSDLMGGAAAGDEDIGAETSSIDPKVTADPK
jgi:hypothetical protein